MPPIKKSKTKARKTTRARKAPAKKTRIGKKASSARWAPGARPHAKRTVGQLAMAGVAGFSIILLVIGVVLWSGGYAGKAASGVNDRSANLAQDAGFAVRRVTLRGARDTAHADVLDAVGPIVGDSILHVDLDAARARVEELGWVRSAAVTRLLPDTIHVSIRERDPSAVWQHNGALNLIDESGAVIKPVAAQAYSHLPMIVGAGAPDAAAAVLQALASEPAIAEMTHALIRVGERRWDLKLRSGLIAKLPDSARPAAQSAAIAELAQLHKTQAILDQDIEYIDLLDPDRVLIRRRGQRASVR